MQNDKESPNNQSTRKPNKSPKNGDGARDLRLGRNFTPKSKLGDGAQDQSAEAALDKIIQEAQAIDVAKKELKISTNPPPFSDQISTKNFAEFLGSSKRAKTSQRIRYEAEVEAIKKQHGDLEEIREKIGLTQRKMCQLLLVDPSAWTRWTKKGDRVPPHIYRALQWYLLVQDKYPQVRPDLWLASVSRATMERSPPRGKNSKATQGERPDIDELERLETRLESVHKQRLESDVKLRHRLDKLARLRPMFWLILTLQTLLLLGILLEF